ncbi:MAG: phage exclusion protein Lit family protein [Xanthobacteraceae bacterium]
MNEILRREKWQLLATAGAPVGGANPFTAYPEDKRIEVLYSGFAMIWCLAVYAALVLHVVRQADGRHGGQIDVGPIFKPAPKYLEYATVLRTRDEDWPAELPVRQAGEPFQTIDRIFFGAASWILLHEIAHVHFRHKLHLLPNDNIAQEDDADKFAARWMLEEVPSNQEREFRILVVGVAIAWLLLFEPLGGDANHPPAVTRMRHVASHFNAPENSIALEVVAHLLKILFSRKNRHQSLAIRGSYSTGPSISSLIAEGALRLAPIMACEVNSKRA